jgi:hypothetical protein
MARQATSGQKRAPQKAVAPKAIAKSSAQTPDSRQSRIKLTGSMVEQRLPGGQQFDGLSDTQKVAILLKEREQLKGAVDALQSRLLATEARKAQLADRIAWALDTLNDLLRDKA